MKGLALPLAAGALLALAALVGVQLLRPAAEPSRAELARQLASELRCPDCQSLSVAESHTAAAGAIRQQITELLAGGASADEVRQHFVDRYGEWILLVPPAGFAWWLPAGVLLAGAAGLTAWLLRGRGRARLPAPAAPAADGRDLRRVRDEVEQLDA